MTDKKNTTTDAIEGEFIPADEVYGEQLLDQLKDAKCRLPPRTTKKKPASKEGEKFPKPIQTDLQLKNLTLKKLKLEGLKQEKPKLEKSKYCDVKIVGISGLVVRIGMKKKSFRWDRGAGKKPRIITYGEYPTLRLKDARKLHEKAQERHAAGLLGEIGADAPTTVAELAEVFYADRIVPTRKRPDVVRQVLDHDIIPSIGKLKLSVVNVLAVRSTVKVMVNRGVKSHAGRALAIMKQMFKFGVSISVMETNPASSLDKVDLGAGDNRRNRVLDADEIKQFWEVLENHKHISMQVRIGLQLLILLGIRSGELRQAKWSDLDTKKKTLSVPIENQKINPRQKKNAKPFIVPVDDFALSLFEHLRGLDGVWIFPGRSAPSPEPVTPRVFSKATRRLLEGGLDVDPFTPHDLRRTMRTNLSKLKVPPHVAELCLNHSLGTIIDTYDQHSYLEERRDALRAWSDKVQVIIGKKSNVLQMKA